MWYTKLLVITVACLSMSISISLLAEISDSVEGKGLLRSRLLHPMPQHDSRARCTTWRTKTNHLYIHGRCDDLFILPISCGEYYYPGQDQGASSVFSSEKRDP